MSQIKEKATGSLALISDYDSDQDEEPLVPSPTKPDEAQETAIPEASAAEVEMMPSASSELGPGPSSSTIEDKKSEEESNIEASSIEDNPRRPTGPCLSESSSDDSDDEETSNRKSPDNQKTVDREKSQSPKEEVKEEIPEEVAVADIHKSPSPEPMEEEIEKKFEEPKTSPESSSEAKPKSPESEIQEEPPKVESVPEEEEQQKSQESRDNSPVNRPDSPKTAISDPLDVGDSPMSSDSLEGSPMRPLTPSHRESRESTPDKPKASQSPKSLPSDRAQGSQSPDSSVPSPTERVDTPKSPRSLELSQESSSKKADSHGSPSPAASPMRKSKTPEKEDTPDVPVASNSPRASMSPVKAESPESSHQSDKKEEAKETSVTAAKASDDSSGSDSDDSDDEEEVEKMDTSEQVGAEQEAGTSVAESGAPEDSNSNDKTNPWETPRQEPIDGVVQPRTDPPPGKPTRHTNCLDYVLFTVIKDAMKHKHSWPFMYPVDANKLEIPEYHNLIEKPMDLRTIEKRIRSLYYWSAKDAIADITQLFNNCYAFNPPEYDVYKMAKSLEKQITTQLQNDLPRSEKPQELSETHRRTMFNVGTPNGKTKAAKQRGRKSARGRKKAAPSRASFKEESIDDQDDAASKVDSIHFDDDDDTITEKDVSRAPSIQPEAEEPKPTTSQPPAKKRKVENGDNGVVTKEAVSTPAPVAAAPPAPTPRKNPNTMIDWKSLVPRWHGKQAEWQKFCSRLLTEIHSVKNKGFAQVFYLPVDPIKLKIYDYLDIIKNPMDLQTIKKKLDHKQYAEPEEFVADFNLMINNCCTYNPKGSAVHQNALDLKALFEERWKLFPRPGVDPIVSDSYINQSLVVNTDLIEEERINSYLSAVRAEEKKCAEKLEQLRNMSESLYTITMQRRDAKLAGSIAPVLANHQLNQLEKLGISIRNTPLMVPELISPALSIRSSTRAPVPKIIDDIGPSPIKARKISKPRASSNASLALAPTSAVRGRKPKSGRPKKNLYSPAASSPHSNVQAQAHRAQFENSQNKRKLDPAAKRDLSDRMNGLSEEHIHPVLRIIQIGQHIANKSVLSLRSLCDEEIDFNEASDDTIYELMKYMNALDSDKAKAARIKQELEVKSKFYGLDAYDERFGPIPKNALKPAQIQNRMGSDSPSPSASRSGDRSSDSDSDSEDSSDSDSEPQPSRGNSTAPPPPRRRAIEISASSSRASTPAGPSTSSKRGPGYDKRTLSESSSSSDSNGSSSDSSDSDSEPAKQVKKTEPTKTNTGAKKPSEQFKKRSPLSTREQTPPVVKNASLAKKPAESNNKPTGGKGPALTKRAPSDRKTPPPPTKKPLSILDELLPSSTEKKPVQTSAPSTSSGPWKSNYKQHAPPPPRMTEAEIKAQKEKDHAEALRRQAEARRRKRQQEEEPQYLNQSEVMREFESHFSY
uniref:Bromo domain-containing protein n=1 Tax=Caenorhabditis tropicalis TaxID=1561998 RepID=A0A1I7U100_9PELO